MNVKVCLTCNFEADMKNSKHLQFQPTEVLGNNQQEVLLLFD